MALATSIARFFFLFLLVVDDDGDVLLLVMDVVGEVVMAGKLCITLLLRLDRGSIGC